MEYTTLSETHHGEIAEILTQNYATAAIALPLMPRQFESRDQIITRLKKHAGDDGFVIALDGGRVAGFIGAYHIPEYKGTAQGTLTLNNMHGIAHGYDKYHIYDELYRRAAGIWAAKGSYTHALLLYPDDKLVNEWMMNGFGMFVIDAVRPLDRLDIERSKEISITTAVQDDMPELAPLIYGINEHLKSSPVFLYGHDAGDSVKEHSDWLNEHEDNILWIARIGGRIAGYLKTNTTEVNMPELDDGHTMAINGAYTLPEFRGMHIMANLLDEALDWARERGSIVRCSTDFETANIDGRRFWLKYFTPASYAMIRRIDERACR